VHIKTFITPFLVGGPVEKYIPNNSCPRYDKESKLDSKSEHAINQHPTKTPQISRIVPFSLYETLQLNSMKKKILLFCHEVDQPHLLTRKTNNKTFAFKNLLMTLLY
jgi:hypothetical protein